MLGSGRGHGVRRGHRTRCSSRGGSRSSSPTSPAASARRAARARAGSRRCCTASSHGLGRPEDLDLLLRRRRRHLARRHERAVRADDDLPARPERRVAGRRASTSTSATRSRVQRRVADDPGDERMSRRERDRRVPMSQWPSTHEYVLPTADGRRSPSPSTAATVEAQTGRAADQGRAGARHLHPALLLARAHEAGRHVPHVPRRGRGRARASRLRARRRSPTAWSCTRSPTR